MNSEDGQVYSVCNFLVLLSTTVCSQNINKQNVNIADETLTDYSFLSWYHYTKSKNYLNRRYRIRHWIPIFIGTPCNLNLRSHLKRSMSSFYSHVSWITLCINIGTMIVMIKIMIILWETWNIGIRRRH